MESTCQLCSNYGIILLRHPGREIHEYDTTWSLIVETVYLMQKHNGRFTRYLMWGDQKILGMLEAQKFCSELAQAASYCHNDCVYDHTFLERWNANNCHRYLFLSQSSFSLSLHSLYQILCRALFTIKMGLKGFISYVWAYLSCKKIVNSSLLIRIERGECSVAL